MGVSTGSRAHTCRTQKARSFTLIELIATIAILAILATMAMFFLGNYVTWANNVADQRTLTVLNDALNRYKCEGGTVSALTLGAPIGNVLTKLASTVSWGGMSHQFLQKGVTYPARSLVAVGTGAQYHFAQYNTYSGETVAAGTPTSQYPYGAGVGYLQNNNDAGGYSLWTMANNCSYIAYQSDSGPPVIVHVGAITIPPANHVTFWTCAGNADPTHAGALTTLGCESNHLVALDIKGLPSLQSVNCSSNSLTALDVSGLTSLTNLSCYFNSIITIKVNGCTSLQSFACYSNLITALDLRGLPALTTVTNYTNPLTDFNAQGDALLSNFSLLGSLTCTVNLAGTALVTSAGSLNTVYSGLPNMTSTPKTIFVGAPAASLGSNTGIATAKGWTVSFTP